MNTMIIPAIPRTYNLRYALMAEAADGAPRQTVTIRVDSGKATPASTGNEGGYWVSESGKTIVHHPSAYARAGGRPSYVSSDRRLSVGIDWLLALGNDLDVWNDEGKTIVSMSRGHVVKHGAISARIAWHNNARCWYVRHTGTGETYHAPRHCDAAKPSPGEGKAVIRLAQSALAQQAQITAAGGLDTYIATHADSLWITREHSLRAGHCKSGTDNAAHAIEQALHADGEVGAVTARFLIEIRGVSDPYTKRAIIIAARS